MSELSSAPLPTPNLPTSSWREIVRKFQEPSLPRALWQIVNTIGSYAALWYLISLTLSISYWLTAGLAFLAGLLVIRIFIIFHDCGHRSYFKSARANDMLGFITGVLTLTPYYHWRWEHAIHHASAADLDKRGIGDVWTMTVEEYLRSSRWRRFAYRLARNPFVLFGLAPIFLFVIRQRFPSAEASPRERASVHWMNLGILAFAVGLSFFVGFIPYLLIHLTIVMVSGSVGIWLFYVQHQFEGVYWERDAQWDFTAAALKGSSFYKLPRILQWFSGNIGFHHIHHLSPRIPNYNLERCHNADPLFQQVPPITLWASLKSLSFRLWDEAGKKLISFRSLKKRQVPVTDEKD